MPRSSLPGTLIALAVLIGGIAFAFALGRFSVSLHELWRVLWSRATGVPSGVSDAVETVVASKAMLTPLLRPPH